MQMKKPSPRICVDTETLGKYRVEKAVVNPIVGQALSKGTTHHVVGLLGLTTCLDRTIQNYRTWGVSDNHMYFAENCRQTFDDVAPVIKKRYPNIMYVHGDLLDLAHAVGRFIDPSDKLIVDYDGCQTFSDDERNRIVQFVHTFGSQIAALIWIGATRRRYVPLDKVISTLKRQTKLFLSYFSYRGTSPMDVIILTPTHIDHLALIPPTLSDRRQLILATQLSGKTTEQVGKLLGLTIPVQECTRAKNDMYEALGLA